MFKSVTTKGRDLLPISKVVPHGITALVMHAVIMAMHGPRINNFLLASPGIISSLKNNLTPSARGWSIPKGPARLGPCLSCIKPAIFLSARVAYMAIKSEIPNIIAIRISL